jgi:hypothetical protein
MTDATAKKQAQDSYWEGKRLLDDAKSVACPRRGHLAAQARAAALRSAGLFSRVGDRRAMVGADDIAAEARNVAQGCGGGIPLHGVIRLRKKRRKKRARR